LDKSPQLASHVGRGMKYKLPKLFFLLPFHRQSNNVRNDQLRIRFLLSEIHKDCSKVVLAVEQDSA